MQGLGISGSTALCSSPKRWYKAIEVRICPIKEVSPKVPCSFEAALRGPEGYAWPMLFLAVADSQTSTATELLGRLKISVLGRASYSQLRMKSPCQSRYFSGSSPGPCKEDRSTLDWESPGNLGTHRQARPSFRETNCDIPTAATPTS